MGTKSDPIFLDVDSSIVENNLLITKDQDEIELDRLFGQRSNYIPTKLIRPFPGFCVKTKQVGNGIKIFVNICKTDFIPTPKDMSDEKLLEVMESEDPSDFRIPMSIGELRPITDKKGADAKVCDIAINTTFLAKIENSSAFKSFFMAVVFQALEQKFGLVCEDEKLILKNRKCFGTLQEHRIQERKIQNFEGIAQSVKRGFEMKRGKNRSLIEIMASYEEARIKEPEYKLFKRNGTNCLIGEFKLPNVQSVNELTLDIGEDRILLESKRRYYLLDIFVPGIIRQEGCTSTFEKNSKLLTVKMPLVGG